MARVIRPSELEFDEPIGDGASAVVYRAKWNSKDVAVKKFNISVRSTMRNDYQNEINLLANISHENVVKVFGFCDQIGNTYIVSELMEGGALDGYIQSSTSIKWSNALPILKGIVNGMAYLHDESILHLDLKSPNILLDKNEKVAKINDFGIAKITTLTSTTTARVQITSRTNSAKGATRWMAPEISQGKDPSRRSDVWSFGCILLEFATRKYPFSNLQDIIIFSFLQNNSADIPINIPADTPTFIALLIEKCLNRSRTDRPTFDAIKDILVNFDSSDLSKTIDKQSSTTDDTITNLKNLKTVLEDIKTAKSKAKVDQENNELKNELKSLREKMDKLVLQQLRPASSNPPQPSVYPIPFISPVYVSPVSSSSVPERPLTKVPSAASPAPNYRSTGEKYVCNSFANGRMIYEGTRGGRFYFTESGNKRYI